MQHFDKVEVVSVFASGAAGGNPAPIGYDAQGMTDADMQAVAKAFGHESGFVLPAPDDSACDFEFRFWVPNHEMSMCGHATIGCVWLLDNLGRLPSDELTILTKSGKVSARIAGRTAEGAAVEITQPKGQIEVISDDTLRDDIISVLGITAADLAEFPIQNASTSRVKTLVPLRSEAILNNLQTDFSRMEAVCTRIGSTGLYPYAVLDRGQQIFDARQFPQSSGYPEDAATGIAASALSFGLLENGLVDRSGRQITVHQGRAMNRPSAISIRFDIDGGDLRGCWIGGAVRRGD
ncbi:PhzF family phenazine biosynthesis protein [Agrobacterium sp. 16-2014-1-2a]|uniref:Phenazine biosynthesis protein PhzF n=1 Tax=Agrobacterium tumefaciens TaxID=358 RepID=A0AB36EC01_AGRTU|nr:phenazine biosynthesis protein PhzF [Agrobacterium tumefaciens]